MHRILGITESPQNPVKTRDTDPLIRQTLPPDRINPAHAGKLRGGEGEHYAVDPLERLVGELERGVLEHLLLELAVYLLERGPGIGAAGAVGHHRPRRRHWALGVGDEEGGRERNSVERIREGAEMRRRRRRSEAPRSVRVPRPHGRYCVAGRANLRAHVYLWTGP